MDFERIAMLLNVFHNSLNVPGVNEIRQAALNELREINVSLLPKPSAAPVEEEPGSEDDTDDVERRKL